MADQPKRISVGHLEPLCALNLPINVLVGYNDAQHGRPQTDNPFTAGTVAAQEYVEGHILWAKDVALAQGFGLWAQA